MVRISTIDKKGMIIIARKYIRIKYFTLGVGDTFLLKAKYINFLSCVNNRLKQ